jgi:regulator of protease activity HflC (stomatin/prohibitin superfamily)
MLSDLPRFNAAKRYGPMLLAMGALFSLLGLALYSISGGPNRVPWYPDVSVPGSTGALGVALWLAAAGFLSAAAMSFARQYSLDASKSQGKKHERSAADAARHDGNWRSTLTSTITRFEDHIPDAGSLAAWQALLPMVFGIVAIVQLASLWRQPDASIDPVTLKIAGGALIVIAFPILVLQRLYANLSDDLLPESPQLDRLLRLPLASCVGLAIAFFLRSAGFGLAAQLERLIGIVILAVALELILRSAVTLFIPFEPIESRRAVANSSIASLLRLTPPNFRALNLNVRKQFGIDLSRSWALAFIQRAALPIVAGIAVFAWLVTGVTALPVNQRGVYERFGVPIAVFGPGLHMHLPWPLGVVRTVEIGVVHQLPIEFLLPNGNGQTPKEEADEKVSAEALPPPSADRLWDNAHPFEGSYLIASQENGQQSFQLSDVDMAVVYQVGLSDDAARDAAYRVTDPQELIQALSGQILVRYLAQNQLLDLLGKSRETFAAEFQTALQKQLDSFSAGIDVLQISIEAIHPPPEAAAAYHDVQAAEIRAVTHVAESRGDAARTQKFAKLQANGYQNSAIGGAAEAVGTAQTASVLFGGDRKAFAKSGNAFLLERWFDNLNKALEKSEYVVIDHRLNGQDVPTLDLRNLAAVPPNETTVPATTTPQPGEQQQQAPPSPFRDDDGG